MTLIAVVIAAYFLGSLPTAVIVGKRIAGINVLEHGSGNPGASNVFRLIGPRWASVTLGVDVFKGYIPVWLVSRVAEHLVQPYWAPTPIAVMAWTGFAAFAGHVYSPFLRFRGGKGASTMLGGMFALAPQATTLTIIVYAGALYLWKTFSVATLSAAVAFPVLLFLREGHLDVQALGWGLLVPALLLFTHRSNIRRLFLGGELPMTTADSENEGD